MSQRKRERGFALMDAAFAADPKFLRLQRKAPDPTAYAACVGVYWLLVADARRTQSPEVNWDDFEEYQEQIALLKEVRLLTDTGFEPETFERWAPAYRSPWDRTRGTQGDAEVREGTQEYAASTHLISTPITSTNVNGNARRTADERTVLVVACPECGASVGAPCLGVRPERNGEEWQRYAVHRPRWQVATSDLPQSFMASPKRGSHDGQHHHCMVCEPIHPAGCAVCAPLQVKP